MREVACATHPLHYQLRYGPCRGKDSASATSLYQCYTPVTDELAATACMAPRNPVVDKTKEVLPD